MRKESPSTTILLIEKEFAPAADVRHWLKGKGFVVWHARDVFELIEDLSDFTVGSSPDIVILKEPVRDSDLAFVKSTLRLAGCNHGLAIWSGSGRPAVPETDAIRTLYQLKTAFCGELEQPSPQSAAAKSA